MKHLIAIILAFAFAPAFAKTDPAVLNMFAHCNCLMNSGTCAPYNLVRSGLPQEAYTKPRILGNLGVVDSGKWWDWNSNPLMCEQLIEDCTLDPGGDGCLIARSQFRQDANFECGGGERAPASSDVTAAAKVAAVMTAAFTFLLLLAPRRRKFNHARQ